VRHSHRIRSAAQRAALFYCVAGLLAIVNSLLLEAAQPQQAAFLALGALDLVIAALLHVLPWERWHVRVLILLIPVTFVVIGLFEFAGATTTATYPIFFILVFIWVGLSLPPRTSLLLAPLTVVGYIVPLLLSGRPTNLVESATVTIPVCILIGEVIAQVVSRLHATQDELEQRVAERTTQLQAANTALQHELAERQKLEARLLQSQKLDGLGRLAGGISHDFNNLLTAIGGYADLIGLMLPKDHPTHSHLAQIQKGVVHASNLTKQLLTFARKQIIEPRVLNLNELIGEMDRLLHPIIGSDIELITRPAEDLGWVKADPGQIEQVLMNLVLNARDAMPGGGTLIIETQNTALDRAYAQGQQHVTEEPYVLLAVSDTGVGMDAEVQVRAFEPFFTTKAVGKGTGLGLATCYGIVEQHGGHISIFSEVGRGTTFTIYLPRVPEPAALTSALAATSELPRGSETVLVVEDQADVRALLTQVLRGQGYTVLEAANGAEAIQMAEGYVPALIDLLLTDVVMPRMGGKELAATITARDPHMKVLFISGYTQGAIVRNGQLEQGIALLHKPFTPAALIRKVREVLDG
jgi:signal transduction histidine kinase/CheY-like chemotaxis protein